MILKYSPPYTLNQSSIYFQTLSVFYSDIAHIHFDNKIFIRLTYLTQLVTSKKKPGEPNIKPYHVKYLKYKIYKALLKRSLINIILKFIRFYI